MADEQETVITQTQVSKKHKTILCNLNYYKWIPAYVTQRTY